MHDQDEDGIRQIERILKVFVSAMAKEYGAHARGGASQVRIDSCGGRAESFIYQNRTIFPDHTSQRKRAQNQIRKAVPPNANIDILLDSRDGAQKIGYWEITSALDKSGQRVLFHAVYSGSESGIVILPGFLVPPAEENDDINSKVIHFLQKNSKVSLQSILDMASAFENAQEDAFSYVDSWGN